MAYRRTANVTRRMAERQQSILGAARALASGGGMNAVQVLPVADMAGIAAGTVYRYFPSKADLVSDLVAAVAEREIAAMQAAGDAAPGPLSALTATIATFASRILLERKLCWAAIAEPSEPAVEAARQDLRAQLVNELSTRIKAAAHHGHLPDGDATRNAAAIIGALVEGLIGPLAPDIGNDAATVHAAVQAMTLLALRGLGVVDARARGLVAQINVPSAATRR